MWNAEKRLRVAANRVIDHEASRTSGRRVTSQIQGIYYAEKANQKSATAVRVKDKRLQWWELLICCHGRIVSNSTRIN